MKKSFTAVIAIALAGSASLAHAQSTSQQSFADRFRVMQSESSGAPAYQLNQPVINPNAPAPNRSMSEADYQALSSGAPAWHPNTSPVYSNGSTFAQTQPHGLSEAYYQGISSEAPAYHPSQNAPSSVAVNAKPAATTSAMTGTTHASAIR